MEHAVIFDMDGVLIDSEVFYFNRRMTYFKLAGIKPAVTTMAPYLGASGTKIWELLVSDPKQRQLIRQDYEEYRRHHEIHYPDVLIPGIKSVLAFLQRQQVKIALASAGEEKEIQRMLVECNLTQYFDVVLSGENIQRNKPDPQIYETTVAHLGLPKENCLAVEDSVNGIASATRAGLQTWAREPTQYHVDQSAADWVFQTYPQFVYRYLQKLSQNIGGMQNGS
jgi:HAD superfamily hydrolase (TIGR01509 family)